MTVSEFLCIAAAIASVCDSQNHIALSFPYMEHLGIKNGGFSEKKKTMDFPMDPIKSSGISRLVMSDGSPATKMVLSSLPRPSGMACAWMMDLVASRHRSPSDLIISVSQ